MAAKAQTDILSRQQQSATDISTAIVFFFLVRTNLDPTRKNYNSVEESKKKYEGSNLMDNYEVFYVNVLIACDVDCECLPIIVGIMILA